jgi:predicted nucleic acid-binding protein
VVVDSRRLQETLTEAERVHIDASVLGLHLMGQPRYTPLTRMLFRLMSEEQIQVSTSAMSLYQLLVEVYRRGEPDTARTAEQFLTTIPGLDVIPVTPTIARQASEVRAQLGGSTERAIQIATALGDRAEIYLTQHSSFRRVAGMRVESLDLYSRT